MWGFWRLFFCRFRVLYFFVLVVVGGSFLRSIDFLLVLLIDGVFVELCGWAVCLVGVCILLCRIVYVFVDIIIVSKFCFVVFFFILFFV